jgi:hypothetical protein
MTGRSIRAGIVGVVLACAHAAVAEEVRISMDLSMASPVEWRIIPDGYSVRDAAPVVRRVDLGADGTYLGFYLSFLPDATPSYYRLEPVRPWADLRLRFLTSVRITVYGIGANCRVGVLVADRQGKSYELSLDTLGFEGSRTIAHTAVMPFDGLVFRAFVIYPDRYAPADSTRVAVYIRDVDIRGSTSAPATAGAE